MSDLSITSSGLTSDVSLTETFWPFSTRLYSRSSVKQACDCLKDKYLLNVNLMMFACWAGMQGYTLLTMEDWSEIVKNMSAWNREIVESLKTLYRQLLTAVPSETTAAVAENLLADIIFAEKVEQTLIMQALQTLKKPHAHDENAMNTALKNLFNYVDSQRIALHKTDLEKIYRIVTECFSESLCT